MICDVIVSFILVFVDGHKESREKWMDHEVAQSFKQTLENPDFLKDLDVVQSIQNFKIIQVP